MHPRTIAIVAGLILAVSLVLRVVIYQAGLLPLSEEIVLKKATSLTVAYIAGKPKTLTIADPQQLAELFAVLNINENNPAHTSMELVANGTGCPVTFHFPGGRSRTLYFSSPNWLGQWTVNPDFYAGLTALVSRAEGGRQINLLLNRVPPEAEKAAEP